MPELQCAGKTNTSTVTEKADVRKLHIPKRDSVVALLHLIDVPERQCIHCNAPRAPAITTPTAVHARYFVHFGVAFGVFQVYLCKRAVRSDPSEESGPKILRSFPRLTRELMSYYCLYL